MMLPETQDSNGQGTLFAHEKEYVRFRLDIYLKKPVVELAGT
jgi:hypothetical protein